MIKNFRNEKGLTLVELLATLVIGALVISLVMGVHIMVQKQYTKQKADIGYFLDVTTAAKAITKDIRMAEDIDVISLNNIKLEWTDTGGNTITRSYNLDGNVVTRDGGGYISDIDTFTFVESTPNGMEKIEFTVKGDSEKQIKTEIYLR